jgi:hypothetical protein
LDSDFEIQQYLGSLKHVINIIIWIRDTRCYTSELVKNSNAMIKCLMRQVGASDELLEQQEEFLVRERKISEELKKLLALKKCKVEKLDQELAKSKKTNCSLKSSIDAF